MQNPYKNVVQLKCRKFTDAQVALCEALVSLLLNKKAYEIGVKELCQIAHVARSTFYVYYQNTDELLEELENYHIIQLLNLNKDVMVNTGYYENNISFYQKTIEYVEINKKVFYSFLINNPNMRFQSKWKDAIKYHLWERGFNTHEIRNGALILEMTASEVIAAYSFVLLHPYDVDMAHVNKIVALTLQSTDITTRESGIK